MNHSQSESPTTSSASLRPSGLGLGAISPGTHWCTFYCSRQDLIETALAFLQAGVESGDRCWWVTPPLSAADAAELLNARLGDRWRRSLSLVAHDGWFRDDGTLDAESGQRIWGERVRAARAEGYAGVRWTDSGGGGPRDRLALERDYDALTGDLNLLTLCSYSLEESTGLDMLQIADTHRCLLVLRDGAWVRLDESTPRDGAAAPRESLARTVRGHRLRGMMTQEELARRAGIQRTYVADIERGARNPTLAMLEKLAQGLSVDIAELLTVCPKPGREEE